MKSNNYHVTTMIKTAMTTTPCHRCTSLLPYWHFKWKTIPHSFSIPFQRQNYIQHTLGWLIACNWVQDLMVPMEQGLKLWTLCAPYRFMGALLLY